MQPSLQLSLQLSFGSTIELRSRATASPPEASTGNPRTLKGREMRCGTARGDETASFHFIALNEPHDSYHDTRLRWIYSLTYDTFTDNCGATIKLS